MTTILFVKANNRPSHQSVSVKLFEVFLEKYRETHPNDKIIELDLYNEEMPYVGVDMIDGRFKADKGLDLTDKEEKAATIADKYLEQFLSADKIVFGFPLWNLTIPAVLHTYIDYLNRVGKTFIYTSEGPKGLLGNKKIVLLNASGGVYSQGPAAEVEMAVKYVTSMMSFFGVKDIEKIVIEGHNQFPDKAEEIIEEGLKKAAKVASVF